MIVNLRQLYPNDGVADMLGLPTQIERIADMWLKELAKDVGIMFIKAVVVLTVVWVVYGLFEWL